MIISFDQWRGDWGNPHKPIIKLEGLERIANDGMTLQRCYTNSPQCVPARFSWLTGLEPSQLGVTRNENVSLPINVPSKIRDLQRKGWYTSIVGKTHWSTHNKGRDLREDKELIHKLGFDEVIEIAGPRALQIIDCAITDDWEKEGFLKPQRDDLKRRYRGVNNNEAWVSRESILPLHLYPDIWISEKAKIQIDKLPTGKPWILWISFVGPHEPFDTPCPWRGLTNEQDLPKSINTRDWIERIKGDCELKIIHEKWKNKVSQNQIKELRKDYADHLKLLDKQINEITKKLEQRNDYENTAITIMADHGEMLGDGGMIYKSTMLESSIHVPMVYRQPNGENKTRTSKRPINLTGAIMQILESIERGGKSKVIRRWTKRQEGAVVEYGEERGFIRENKKICVNKKGEIIWATDLRKDPMELVNQAESIDLMKTTEWSNIIKWAQKVKELRENKNWVWKDLLKNKFDQI